MANTFIHKFEAKFRNKILPRGKNKVELSFYELSFLFPKFVRNKWKRENCDYGHFKSKRMKIRLNQLIKVDGN